MGSAGETSNKGIEPSVSELVWVRRRNGSWWPGRIMGLDELFESCLVSPRLGTPVKLLGREDTSVLLPKTVAKPLQNAFILVAFPLVGVSAALDALIDISGGKVNIHVLMALAAFASVFMGNALEGGLLLAMFNLAHIAEEYFTSRSMIDVKELKENHPESALVLDMNEDRLPNTTDLAYKRVPVHNIEVGSYILVGAGKSVPVDCEVFQGNATITIEHLTGEVKPLEIKVGDKIPGGARNLDCRIIVKATKTWKKSTLSKIVQLTEQARLNKPKLQSWLDQFGEQYSKVVVVLSVAIALIGPFLFKWPFFGTSGKLAFKAIEPIYGHQAGNNNSNLTTCCIPNCEKEALAVAAAMEKGTTHPIGRAVVDHSVGKDLPSVSVESFEYFPGRGLIATLNSLESLLRGWFLRNGSMVENERPSSVAESELGLLKQRHTVSGLRYFLIQSSITLFLFFFLE
ncbi:probable cadmium/zinc-transporting ATPase HMA1, chloroplastic [Humulus lupulus]|uniref:probable cadmium/zinc-transporting ATPase HMA1, chloroplastic n=1 Tax=Humulus lupulus TaxID=3486 RepID=UPI002B4004E9|nr:probable cadmium/zinc-transporting ATPase HMA1, chloroplastic [Humulus lupulus]